MADDRISMPSGMGGLVRYFDEYKSKLHIRPAHVVLMVILLVAFEAIIRMV